MSAPIRIDDYLETFMVEVLRDAWACASAKQWRRRADQFQRVGNERCDTIAQACRNHAALLDETWADDNVEAIPRRVTCSVCGTPTSPWSCSCGQTRVGRVA